MLTTYEQLAIREVVAQAVVLEKVPALLWQVVVLLAKAEVVFSVVPI